VSSVDPYKILGVPRDASDGEIRKKYRNLAKKLHPDLNPGDREAEAKFKEVSAAYDLLSDREKRARFDRGEIDASGAERPRHREYYRDFADAGAGFRTYDSDAGFADFINGGDILSEIFGRAGRDQMRSRGGDVRYRMTVPFLDAINGATRRLTMPDGSVLEVVIPPGSRNHQTLRLRGKGRPGRNGGPPGDALVELDVEPHPVYRRDGDDIHFDLPISLSEAMLGGRITVPTPAGTVTMTIPRGANTGRVLRLKGKGVPRADGSRGNALAHLQVMLPDPPDPELERCISRWTEGRTHNPRQRMES
jgi:DnaJ-class molecular chaperone